jgi:hypothetical protein
MTLEERLNIICLALIKENTSTKSHVVYIQGNSTNQGEGHSAITMQCSICNIGMKYCKGKP